MATYANVDSVTARLGRPVTDSLELEQIRAWLQDAESAIRSKMPNLDDLIALFRVSVDTVISVEARAVVRVARNPDGWRQASLDDWNGMRDQALSSGQVNISDAEWLELMPWTKTSGLPNAFMLDLGTPWPG